MVIRTIGSVLEVTGLPRTDPSTSNAVSYNLYLNPIKFLRIYISVIYLLNSGTAAGCLSDLREELSVVWILLGVIKMREALVIQL